MTRKIEEGVNAVLKAELAGFLGYEKRSSAGWHTGNSRNGSYQRTIVTSYGKITVDVPRDRNGEFQSPLLPERKQRVDSLETTIIQLYQRGVTTRQIAELIEQMYGHYYTPATISKITADVSEQVAQFHSRPVAKRYAVIFCDAMYVNLRRDSVAKEAIHVLLGITPDGHKEVLDYAILPSESALNYADRGFAGTVRLHGLLRLQPTVLRESSSRISGSIFGIIGDVRGLSFRPAL